MINFGAVPAGAVLPFFFDTFDGGTGASITLTDLAITDVEIYKGTSMTQRASDAGVVLLDTDGIDLDGITGIHGFSIDTGDNTDAGFFTVGSFFTVVVSAVTIDGQTVNFVAGTFRLMHAEAEAGVPNVNIDQVSGDVVAADTLELFAEALDQSTGQIDSGSFAAGAINAAAIAADAIGSSELAASAVNEIADQVWDELLTPGTHNVGNSAGRRLRNIDQRGTGTVVIHSGTAQAGSANTITLDAAASPTNDIFNGNLITITAGTGLGQSRKIIDYNGATKVATVDKNWIVNPTSSSVFEITAAVSGVVILEGVLVSATATTAVLPSGASTQDDFYNTGILVITGGTGSGQAREISDYVGGTLTATVAAWSVTPDSTSVFAIVPSGANVDSGGGGTGPTATEIAAAVWNEAQVDHVAVGSFGITASEIADILADTGELQIDLADGGRLDLLIDAIKSKTDNLPLDPADASVIAGRFDTLDTSVAGLPTATENADELLKRDWTAVAGEASRSVLNALRFLRNKWSVTGTILTVKKEDDATDAWTATVSEAAGEDPIRGIDPS